MTSVSDVVDDEADSVRTRLIRAADVEFETYGDAVQMESIAKRAGVSRATAFRRLGTMAEVVVQVALLRAQRHIAEVGRLMQRRSGAIGRIEVALIYTTRELPKDPSIAALIAQHAASVRDPRVHGAAKGVMGRRGGTASGRDPARHRNRRPHRLSGGADIPGGGAARYL